MPDANYRSLPRASFQQIPLANRDANTFDTGTAQNANNHTQYDGRNNILEDELHDICESNELLVRNEMEGLGISLSLINSHIERGARSPIIGTYRILLHR